MEGYSQHWMYVKREQILKSSHSHLEAVPVGDDNNNYSWEERAFAEDSTRILGGSMWPPRSYSCTFCKREFRSAQALGGHMNIHRRDRARLKQNHSPHNYQPLYHHHHHHKNDFKSLLGNNHFSAPEIISTQIDCGLMSAYSSPATTITTTRLSSISTQENCGQHNFSPCSSEQEDYNFNYDYVETSLSVGVNSMCGQKSSPSCKRLKTSISSPEEIPLGLNHGMEDLDLELRLGKQQKVK